MEKLEQYLDQVCRTIGGPVEMRRHVRQELREHLLDAIAQHKAAGLSEQDAIQKALDEFGKPEEVRSDLESAHGQRTMWLIDKAMQWKEMTMRAKWLWTTWAYLTFAGVIALEVLYITFIVILIVPKFQKLTLDGMIDSSELEQHGVMWGVNFLYDVSYVGGHHTSLLILVAAMLWGLFEWRVKSENKTFMRLSALGSVAVGLTIIVALTAVTMVVSFCLAMPAMGRMSRPWGLECVAEINASIEDLEKARTQKDWEGMQKHATRARDITTLFSHSPAPTALAATNDAQKAEDLRTSVRTVEYHLKEVERGIREHDLARLDKALADSRKAFEPVREAARVLRK